MPHATQALPGDIFDLPASLRLSHSVRFLARAAAEALRYPIVGISLLTRDPGFDLSRFLVGPVNIASDRAMCRATLRGGDVLVIRDLREHPIFASSNLVTGEPFVRAYAGCIMRTPALVPIGTFCLFDTAPRDLTGQQSALLRGFAQSAADYLNNAIQPGGIYCEEAMRELVASADVALSVGNRHEAEHLVHLAYTMFDELN